MSSNKKVVRNMYVFSVKWRCDPEKFWSTSWTQSRTQKGMPEIVAEFWSQISESSGTPRACQELACVSAVLITLIIHFNRIQLVFNTYSNNNILACVLPMWLVFVIMPLQIFFCIVILFIWSKYLDMNLKIDKLPSPSHFINIQQCWFILLVY